MSQSNQCFPSDTATAVMPEILCALDPDARAAFIRNKAGDVCITFSDPAYVRAESVVVDEDSCAVYAILHERAHYLGNVSGDMAAAFANRHAVLLSALRADGTIFETSAPITIGRA